MKAFASPQAACTGFCVGGAWGMHDAPHDASGTVEIELAEHRMQWSPLEAARLRLLVAQLSHARLGAAARPSPSWHLLRVASALNAVG